MSKPTATQQKAIETKIEALRQKLMGDDLTLEELQALQLHMDQLDEWINPTASDHDHDIPGGPDHDHTHS